LGTPVIIINNVMRIVAIADTHGLHNSIVIPGGDVLIHAGDFTSHGTLDNLIDFCTWLETLPHKHKVIVAGNHDQIAQKMPLAVRDCMMRSGATYLIDEATTIEGVKLFGSPWTPSFMNWYFMANRGKEIAKKWAMIPKNTAVLITHGPPAAVLDAVDGLPQGCYDLLQKIEEVQPLFHVFGHIHEGYGTEKRDFGTMFINASTCTWRNEPVNSPVVFEI